MSAKMGTLLSLIILFSNPLYAKDNKKELLKEYFAFSHENCNLSILPITDEHEYLKPMLKQKLSERNFKYKFIKEERQLKKHELYLTFEVTSGNHKAYKDCIVETIIYKAESNYRISSYDKALFKNKSKRSFPRITFKGKERCTRALRDSFIDIPYCEIEKKRKKD